MISRNQTHDELSLWFTTPWPSSLNILSDVPAPIPLPCRPQKSVRPTQREQISPKSLVSHQCHSKHLLLHLACDFSLTYPVISVYIFSMKSSSSTSCYVEFSPSWPCASAAPSLLDAFSIDIGQSAHYPTFIFNVRQQLQSLPSLREWWVQQAHSQWATNDAAYLEFSRRCFGHRADTRAGSSLISYSAGNQRATISVLWDYLSSESPAQSCHRQCECLQQHHQYGLRRNSVRIMRSVAKQYIQTHSAWSTKYSQTLRPTPIT